MQATIDMVARLFVESHSIGIIGYGHFGKLVDRYIPATENHALIYDPRCTPDGKRYHTFEAVARCDVVILAVPISKFKEVLEQVLAAGGTGVIVDVCTVKEYPVRLLAELAAGRQWMSFHAMFGPEGVKKRHGLLRGLRIVAAEHSVDPALHEQVLSYFLSLDLVVERTSAEEHDVLLAKSLFLAQYIGRAMDYAGFIRSRVGTVSFDLLMDMVDIVKNDAALFRDVVKFNRHCSEARRLFHEGLAGADEEYEMALRS